MDDPFLADAVGAMVVFLPLQANSFLELSILNYSFMPEL